MSKSTKEIERKWLVKIEDVIKFSDACISRRVIRQNYLSLNPEIRIRKEAFLIFATEKAEVNYTLTTKSSGALVRSETEIPITQSQYWELNKLCKGEAITKETFDYIGGDFIATLNIMDEGEVSEFGYLEIEYDDEESSVIPVEFPDFEVEEVTFDPYWKMKNYWERVNSKNTINMNEAEQELDDYFLN